jgi:hypothetical protein
MKTAKKKKKKNKKYSLQVPSYRQSTSTPRSKQYY